MTDRTPFAEVIGDPITHSRSPLIHGHWLKRLGIAAAYRATLVSAEGLGDHLAERRDDPAWLGCNVTAPHKLAAMPLLDRLTPAAERIGAVNCITREGETLVGHNSDADGVLHALRDTPLAGGRAVVIGAGGAARAALHALLASDVAEIRLLARSPLSAARLQAFAPARIRIIPWDQMATVVRAATLIVNATPMGMAHAAPMPGPLLASLATAGSDCTVFDMVYEPLRTPFLTAAAAAGLHTVDGLEMLIGQARRAFELFFGVPAPGDDALLRRKLLA